MQILNAHNTQFTLILMFLRLRFQQIDYKTRLFFWITSDQSIWITKETFHWINCSIRYITQITHIKEYIFLLVEQYSIVLQCKCIYNFYTFIMTLLQTIINSERNYKLTWTHMEARNTTALYNQHNFNEIKVLNTETSCLMTLAQILFCFHLEFIYSFGKFVILSLLIYRNTTPILYRKFMCHRLFRFNRVGG